MLERLGTPGYETLSRADTAVLERLDAILAINSAPVFYEIGVGIGATTLSVAERMGNRGNILIFSRANDVSALAKDLADRGYTNVDSRWGSGNETYAGYHFELARGFVEKALPRFDLAYIDGGHVFHLDAPATSVLKELCKPSGYMIFDDWNWSMAKSPTMNPKKRPQTVVDYDQAQIEACHVQFVCKVLMDTDERFEFLGLDRSTAVYRRRNELG